MSKHKHQTMYRSVERIVDSTTGEVLSEHQRKIVRYKKQTKFIFLKPSKNIYQLSGSELKLLIFITENKMLDVDEIVVVKSLKEKAAEMIGISVGRIDNILSKLVAKDVLSRKDQATYKLNPDYTWKGTLPSDTSFEVQDESHGK